MHILRLAYQSFSNSWMYRFYNRLCKRYYVTQVRRRLRITEKLDFSFGHKNAWSPEYRILVWRCRCRAKGLFSPVVTKLSLSPVSQYLGYQKPEVVYSKSTSFRRTILCLPGLGRKNISDVPGSQYLVHLKDQVLYSESTSFPASFLCLPELGRENITRPSIWFV